MDEARTRAANGAPHGLTVVARSQRRGRGRTGAHWASPPDAGLYCTIVLYVPATPALGALSPLLGLSCVQALRAQGIAAEVKWPNDLWWRGRKLGGLLVQREALGPTGCCLLVGIGLNLTPTACVPGAAGDSNDANANAGTGTGAEATVAIAPVSIAEAWGGDKPADVSLPPADHWLALLRLAVAEACGRWSAGGLRPTLQAAYADVHALHDSSLSATGADGRTLTGRCLGVTACGGLRLRLAGGADVIVQAGAVHKLRPMPRSHDLGLPQDQNDVAGKLAAASGCALRPVGAA